MAMSRWVWVGVFLGGPLLIAPFLPKGSAPASPSAEQAERAARAAKMTARATVLDRLVPSWPKGWAEQRCEAKAINGAVPAISFVRLRDFVGERSTAQLASDESEVKLTSLYFSISDHPQPTWPHYTYERVGQERAPLFDAKVGAVVFTAKLALPAYVKFTGSFFGGEYLGGIRFVDLESGKVLCQAPIRVQNSSTVTKGFLQTGAEAARADLGTRIHAAMDAAAQRIAPGVHVSW